LEYILYNVIVEKPHNLSLSRPLRTFSKGGQGASMHQSVRQL